MALHGMHLPAPTSTRRGIARGEDERVAAGTVGARAPVVATSTAARAAPTAIPDTTLAVRVMRTLSERLLIARCRWPFNPLPRASLSRSGSPEKSLRLGPRGCADRQAIVETRIVTTALKRTACEPAPAPPAREAPD